MKKYVNIQNKSLDLAIKIKYLYKYLINKSEFIISKQVFKSGTSIGASIWEAKFSESRNDLIHKYKISLKETHETLYWLKLLHKTQDIGDSHFIELFTDTEELLKILVATIKKLQQSP